MEKWIKVGKKIQNTKNLEFTFGKIICHMKINKINIDSISWLHKNVSSITNVTLYIYNQ